MRLFKQFLRVPQAPHPDIPRADDFARGVHLGMQQARDEIIALLEAYGSQSIDCERLIAAIRTGKWAGLKGEPGD